MLYTFDWYTHEDPDELDFYLADALGKAGYDASETDIDELCQVFARPFYETKWNITLDTESHEIIVNSINGQAFDPPFVLRGGIAQLRA